MECFSEDVTQEER